MSQPATPPPKAESCLISFPAPHILLVTINRANQMNSIPFAGHWELHSIFTWFDAEPTLRCAIITGAGPKAFCAGQDLIELGQIRGSRAKGVNPLHRHPPSGFAGVSRRTGKKPIIAAVNGWAMGGGFEIVLNCDMVVASENAKFGLPESLRGIFASAGGLPRLVRNVGIPIASEVAMAGRTLSAAEALQYQLVNKVSSSPSTLIEEAVALASKVADISPDAIIVTRAGLREAWETGSVERAAQVVDDRYSKSLMDGENTREGLAAFAEKRKPKWVASKL